MSFPKWPNFDEDEILKVSKILKSGKVNYWTGEEGKSFEKEFSVLKEKNVGDVRALFLKYDNKNSI